VENLYLATVSLSELLLGIASLPAGKRRSALAGALDEQIMSLFAERIVPFDVAGARAYAEIVARARRRGHSMAIAGARIAAIAASRGFRVATRDEAPFQAAGIKVNRGPAPSDGTIHGVDNQLRQMLGTSGPVTNFSNEQKQRLAELMAYEPFVGWSLPRALKQAATPWPWRA
jgi:predicted nucleic acid-binding protein